MAKKKWNMTCPKCGKTVWYWPNCSESTCPDYHNYEWVITREGIRQFMHRKCPTILGNSFDQIIIDESYKE